MAETRHAGSLRTRLLGLLLSATAAVWAGALIFTYLDTRDEVGELLDAHLAQSAALILVQANRDMEEIETGDTRQLHRYARKVVFQVWDRSRTLRLHSINAPTTPLSSQEDGFSDTRLDGKRWRVFSSRSTERDILVQVAERYSARDEIAEAVVEHLIVPASIALPMLAFIAWFAVTRTVKPLIDLSSQVAARDPGRLEPVQVEAAPVEVRPLIDGLNRLFERVAEMIEKERRFTADAAHELRTPLAALRAQAQVARSASDDSERASALDKVMQGCDRAAHLVEQLLVLARLDPGAALQRRATCDLADVAADAIATLAPSAVAKGVELGLARSGVTTAAGDAGLLGILLRNLIDNAVRYSPGGTSVRIEVSGNPTNVQVVVQDQGPGIAKAERARVWERFYRIAGSGEEGSGLGLSIVQRIAELHGAEVRLEDGPMGQGARAVLSLPIAVYPALA